MTDGVVIRWLDDRGFGFIKAYDRDRKIFVHRTHLKNTRDLLEGEKVRFQVKDTKKGPKAVGVKVVYS
ncbi:MAG: cold shock domain-containing protein [Candidatus Aenigmarchaeota archaeon]|nr:cold shock domain-containing protein [Candidatus Aenigmarchaeota archaeon]